MYASLSCPHKSAKGGQIPAYSHTILPIMEDAIMSKDYNCASCIEVDICVTLCSHMVYVTIP